MRMTILAVVLAAASAAPVLAQTPPAAPAASPAAAPTAHPKYDENTSFKVLLADPAASDVLVNHWPVIIDAVRGGGVPETRTMKDAVQSESARSQGGLTDEIYARIVADLAKL
jgi:hypothetical protein